MKIIRRVKKIKRYLISRFILLVVLLVSAPLPGEVRGFYYLPVSCDIFHSLLEINNYLDKGRLSFCPFCYNLAGFPCFVEKRIHKYILPFHMQSKKNHSCNFHTLQAAINPFNRPSTFMFFSIFLMGFLFQFLRRIYRRFRNLFDVLISIVIVSLTFPFILIAAVLIKLDSPGPIFYRQKRVGLNRRKRAVKNHEGEQKRSIDNLGHVFTIFKLRTMYWKAESSSGAVWAQDKDNRITRVGKFLRKTRLDEIPQLFNVLKGEMSFIGPRPERPEFVRNLNSHIKYYFRRHHIKPGITGLAQVRYQYASSIKETRIKVKYDLLYLEKMCFFMDLLIMFDTLKTVFLFKGAR